ncbi:hypothetical protein ACFORG_21045 [Lutimaribacter marinistellae]|uniref:Uncharacterized protein n=1 Tax=Lutimaribacter marinistellae TaxID=1820329 RepID=A0ABV7TLY5_9RHOB
MLRIALLMVLTAGPALAQTATVSGTDGRNALGTVPCTAIAGAALRDCPAELVHKDNGDATLSVALPGGEIRRIYFSDGKATSSSATAAMTSEVQGDMMVIFIDPGETYRVPAAAVAP